MARFDRSEGGGGVALGDRERRGSALGLRLAAAPLIAGVVAVALLCAAAIMSDAPPRVAPADAPLEQFSAERAMAHVRELARSPRPVGSAANAAARSYIADRLRSLSLDPELQEAESAVAVLGRITAAHVTNVVARIPGTGSGRAVALVAHYDTVPNSPGASDDAAGVATLLEAARALKSGAPLGRDVVLLFTDGEEQVSLGAIAFVREHRWSRDLGVVLNFDSRGSRGVSAMYDTSQPNGRLIELFARSAPFPFGSSSLSALSKILPNDTDLTVFKREGLQGLGFAYASGFDHYHQVTDSVESLDPRSLQHHGSYAVSLARALGEGDLRAQREGERVYFDVLRRWLVSYPASWTGWAGVLLAAGYAALVLVARRRGRARWRRLGLGALAAGVAVVLAAVASRALTAALSLWLQPEQRAAEADLLVVAHLCLALVASSAAFSRALRHASDLELHAGVLGLWTALSLALGWFAPGTSYVAQWPLVFALAGLAFAILAVPAAERVSGLRLTIALCASIAPAAIVLAPFVHVVHVMIGVQEPAVSAGAFGLATSLLVPWTAVAWLPRQRGLTVALSALAIAAAVAAARGGPGTPSASSLTLALDAESQRARWITPERRPGKWLRAAMGEARGREAPRAFGPEAQEWTWSDAPPMTLPAPEVRASDGGPIGRDQRAVVLELRSLRGARCIAAWQTGGPEITATRVNGVAPQPWIRFSPRTDKKLWMLLTGQPLYDSWNLEYCGTAGAPVQIELAVRVGARLELRVADSSDGLALPVAARPPEALPTPGGDRTIVSRRLELDVARP